MVLIFSDEFDVSTNHIIDWLLFYNISFLRINDLNLIQVEYIDIEHNKFRFKYENKIIEDTCITGYIFRRGQIINPEKSIIEDSEIKELINKLVKNEKINILHYLMYVIENNKLYIKIGSFFRLDINKLYQLNCAKEVGLIIPKTLLTKNLNENNNSWITKSLTQVYEEINSKYFLMNYTNTISKFPKKFGLSFVQKKIQKKFEIRSFFLDEKFYSMAIFSQNNEKTSTDFRRYDHGRPNRFIPFELPFHLKVKLKKLMRKLSLNTGSIDLIYSEANEFVFLEVNPVGQFGMVSHPCNYALEKLIAQKFLKDGK